MRLSLPYLPTVYVITAVFNRLDSTRKFLKCINRQTYPKIRTIIVDDGSTDQTYDFIKKNYPEVVLLKGNGKLWWTGGINLALRQAQKFARNGDFILTINNDCTFNKNLVANLVKCSIENNRAIVGSLEVDSEDKRKIITGAITIDWSKGIFHNQPKFKDEIPRNQKTTNKIDFLLTKGTIFPIEVFKKIGNFNQKKLPHYASDFEFTNRAKRNGFKLILSFFEFTNRAKRNGFKLILSFKDIIYGNKNTTGITDTNNNRLTFTQFYTYMFSRKSQVNIVDHWNFVTLCCPQEYKLKNYFLIFMKFLYYISRTALFFWMRPYMVQLKRNYFNSI